MPSDWTVPLVGGLADVKLVDMSLLLLELPAGTSSSSTSLSGRLSSLISSTAGFERLVVDESGRSTVSDRKILPRLNSWSPSLLQ